MKIEDFGGLKTEQGHTYFYEPAYENSKDRSIVILSNAQAKTLLDEYHRRQPLKNAHDHREYGSFADRDARTKAELVVHIFSGPLQPFQVEPFSISPGCVGYTRHGFRALTNAMVTMGLPLIPIEVSNNELQALGNLVGKPHSTVQVEDFLKRRGDEFSSIRQGFTPAQYSYQKNFPFGDIQHSEVVKATEISLFLLDHQAAAASRLPAVARNLGLNQQDTNPVFADKAEWNRIQDRDNQRQCATLGLLTLYDADRQGIPVSYKGKETNALHCWNLTALTQWSRATMLKLSHPLRSSKKDRAPALQQDFIDNLPSSPKFPTSPRALLQAGLDAFRRSGPRPA